MSERTKSVGGRLVGSEVGVEKISETGFNVSSKCQELLGLFFT